MPTLNLNHLSEINKTAKEIINYFGDNKIIAFYGDMGAGKTTLINNLAGLNGTTKDGSCYINSETNTVDKGMKMSSGQRQLANYLFIIECQNIQ